MKHLRLGLSGEFAYGCTKYIWDFSENPWQLGLGGDAKVMLDPWGMKGKAVLALMAHLRVTMRERIEESPRKSDSEHFG
jgi:hypothetical protein